MITEDRSAAARGGKYLTFALAQEEYGFPIVKVREIIGYIDVTAVPRMPSYVLGVMNLRGQVIAVMDLRAKFGMEQAPRTEQTCIIVVEIARGSRRLRMGVVVDRVLDVLKIPADAIEDTPAFDASVQTDFIHGIAKVAEGIKILLDVDKVLTPTDAITMESLADKAA